MRRRWLLVVAVITCCAAGACGGGSRQSFAPGPAPVVHASGASNATLSGTYGIAFNGDFMAANQITDVYSGIGTLDLDGAGNISGGAITVKDYQASGVGSGQCLYDKIAGTYAVSGDGSLTITFTGGAEENGGCSQTVGLGLPPVVGHVASSGDSFIFADNTSAYANGNADGFYLSGSAVR